MKRFKNISAIAGIIFIFVAMLNFNANAGAPIFVNEVEINPPNPTVVSDRCQYVEIRSTANSTIPNNVYFISINSDAGNFGFLNIAVDIGGQNLGANGLLVLLNTQQGACPNRTIPAGTTVLNYSAPTSLGQGSEGFYVVGSTTALQSGTDADTNDDGMVDSVISYIDGFNLIFNPDEQFAYGPGENLLEALLGDVPDAVTRIPGNNTPFAKTSFYFGELATTPEETVTYVAPFSSNAPAGAVLTPGAANFGTPVMINPTRFDYDGDGKADLSVFRPSEGNWYVNGSSNGFSVVKFGIATDVLTPGDFDGDGRTDYAIFRADDNADNPDFYILTNDGFSFSGASWGISGDIPAIADYDGDGKDDIAVYRPSNNTFYAINSGGGNTIRQFGSSGDLPVPADYDGDGTGDFAVYQNGSYMAMLSGGGTVTIPVGQAGDIAAPADFDGDGIVDQAVFRPGNGTWYVRQSSTNTIVETRWGTAGDVPVAADYDGDGKADFAIYRNGQWWIQQTTSGQFVTRFGLATDAPTPGAYNQ
jgi:hypothetical protein